MHIYVTFYILPFFSLKEDAGIYIYIVILTIYIYIYTSRSPGHLALPAPGSAARKPRMYMDGLVPSTITARN